MSAPPPITNYFKTTKKRRLSDTKKQSQPPSKVQATQNNAVVNNVVAVFRQAGMLSPKKKQQQQEEKEKEVKPVVKKDLVKLLGKAEKLEDLRKALGRFRELERDRKKKEEEVTPTGNKKETKTETGKDGCSKTTPIKEKRPVTPTNDREKDAEGSDVFSSPVKLGEIKISKKKPAFKKFHHLLSATPTLSTPTTTTPTNKTQLPEESVHLPLPHSYTTLHALFSATETVASILTNRGESITFSKLRDGVRELYRSTGLKEVHIGMFLTVLPGCFLVERVGRELGLSFPAGERNNRVGMEGRRAEFREKLGEIVAREHLTFLSSLTPPITVPSATKITRHHPRFPLESLPPIQPHPLPEIPTETIATARDLISKAKNILEANSRVRGVVRKMTAEDDNKLEEKKVVENKPGVVSVSKLKGVSAALIEKIRARESAKTLSTLTTPPSVIKQQLLLSKLPTIVPILRNIFTSEKKTALEYDLVIERVFHSLDSNNLERETLKFLLQTLSTKTPNFLQLLRTSSVLLIVKVVEGNILSGLVGRAVGGDAIVNNTVRLRKVLKDTTQLVETDCVETMFMSPFHHPVTFSANSTLGERQDKSCAWNFVGTEPCLPTLSCSSFTVPCSTSSLEVTDGVYSYERYCGDNKPEKVMASNEMRDLYVKLVGAKGATFECKVTCSRRGQTTGHKVLSKSLDVKMDGRCLCGRKPNDNRIVNGVDAEKNEFPWLVALVEAGTRQPFCGGSIINDRMIVTAGHCFKGRFLDINNIEIIVNGHLLDSTPNLGQLKIKPGPKKYPAAEIAQIDASNGSYRFVVEEAFIHPLYVSETNDFDVATILLSTPIDFKKIKTAIPICLPELPLSYMRTFGRRKATIAGWGLPGVEALATPPILQKLEVNVFLPSECKELYRFRVNRRMLCAGYKQGGKDSCAGDSGGPLVVEDKKQVWVQIGSVSWGDGCAKEANPGVYFRTTESGQWLRHTANKNSAVWCAVPE